MPSNIEIKARATDYSHQLKIARDLSQSRPIDLLQEDIFFNVSQGRLKLRIFTEQKAELIYYERNDITGPKKSEYLLYPTEQPDLLKNILSISHGIRGVIKKKRTLLMFGPCRIHLDQVENLGNFIELEYVLSDDKESDRANKTLKYLMGKLGINQKDMINRAYIDMMDS